jgi:hypothetical protein
VRYRFLDCHFRNNEHNKTKIKVPEGVTEAEGEGFLLPKTLICCPETNLSTEKPLRAPSSNASMVQATIESSKKVSSSAFKKLDP